MYFRNNLLQVQVIDIDQLKLLELYNQIYLSPMVAIKSVIVLKSKFLYLILAII